MNLLSNLVSSPLAAAGLRWLVESALSVSLLFGVAAMAHVALRGVGAAWRHLLWAATLTAALIVPVVSAVGPRVAMPGAPAWIEAPAPNDAGASVGAQAQGDRATAPRAAPAPAREPAASATDEGAATAPSAEGVTSAPPSVSDPAGTESTTRHEGGAGSAGERATAGAPATTSPGAVTGAATPRPTSGETRPSLAGRALALWFLGGIVVLLPLSLAGVGLRRMARRAERVRDAEWLVLAEDAAHEIGLERPFVLLESDDVEVPMTWGLASPRVVLPRSASAWTVERRRAVLMHELAHIKRHDCLSQCVAQVACAVFWFHPAAWMAARQLRVERERACDDLVLLARTRASDYADHLLDVVRELRATGVSPLGAVAFARPSQFEGRLLAVLDPRRRRDALSGAHAWRIGVIALVAAAGFATLRPWTIGTAIAGDSVDGMRVGRPRSVWVHGAVGREGGIREPSAVIVAPEDGSLERRWQWAMSEIERRGISGPVWIGYALSKRSEPDRGYATDTRGFTWDMLDEDDDGLKLGEALQSAGATPDPQDVAMLFRLPGDGDPSTADRLRAQNVTFGCELEKRTLLWLGDVPDDESAEWIIGFESKLADTDLQQGALNLLGLHRAEGRVAPLLTRYARGEGPKELRKDAVQALGMFPTAATQSTLVDLARRDASSEVRREAVEALGRMGRTEAADELLRIARDSRTPTDVRRQAIESLERHIDEGDAATVISGRAKDKSAKGKIHAESETYVVEPQAAVPPVEPVEPKSKSKHKPFGGDWGFGTSGDRSADPDDVVDPADAEDEEYATKEDASAQIDVQRQAIESIGRYPANVAIPRLRSFLRTDAHPDLRRQAIESLGRMDEPEARQIVADAVWKDRDLDVMRQAVNVLSRQGDASAGFLMEVVTKHPHADIRRSAVDEFRHLTTGAAVPRLAGLIHDGGDPDVQRQAVETMARFGGDDVVAKLQDVIRNHPSGDVRRQAVESLSRMDPELALPVLEELLQKGRKSRR